MLFQNFRKTGSVNYLQQKKSEQVTYNEHNEFEIIGRVGANSYTNQQIITN